MDMNGPDSSLTIRYVLDTSQQARSKLRTVHSVGRGEVRRADHPRETARLRKKELLFDQPCRGGRRQRRVEEVTS